MNEMPPTFYNINKEELKKILVLAQEGIAPLVEYEYDSIEMLKRAYEIRGERLFAIETIVAHHLQYE